MNINTASQHQGVLAYSGVAAAYNGAVDIRHHVHFSFTFNVIADIGADTHFEIQAAPADVANPCNPGVFVPIEEVVICDWTRVPAAKSEVIIPAGTKKGAICTATLPCKPNAFVKVVAGAGEPADVQVVVTLSGPR